MTSIASTPAEIWQLILRYVINVPVFLDPDSITDYPASSTIEDHAHSVFSSWNDEQPYWDAERSRNVCRRVCRAWDRYLGQTVGHRFVRVRDVIKGRIPVSALNQAIRISASYYLWDEYQFFGFPWTPQPEWWLSAAEFIALIPNEPGSKAQILIAPLIFQSLDLSSLAIQLPNLVTFVHAGEHAELGDTLKHFHRLLHLYTVQPQIDMPRRLINYD